MSKVKLSREDVHALVHAITEDMQTESFAKRAQEAVKRDPPPTSEWDLINIYEELQKEFIARYQTTRPILSAHVDGNNSGTPLDAAAILDGLKEAVLHYPDEETKGAVRQMCTLQESQMMSLCAVTPSLAPLVKPKECGGGCHGHSHSHSHDHGHSHSHGTMTQQQMMGMQMAVRSLSPQLQQDMMRIQQSMQSGRQISVEDAKKMQEIQNHVKAFMATLGHFSGGNAAK